MHATQSDDYPPLIAIFGPTASGKSALALALAQAYDGEIIGADSRQVYRYMDIGTDKPSPGDRATVPHHLIDMVDPDEPFTLAMYQDAAYKAIDDVLSRGRLPILAGGTSLYINAVTEGWVIPRVEPDTALRAGLEQEAALTDPSDLHARLATLDPAAARTILPSNTRRVIRALEVVLTTGRPISEQQRKQRPPYRLLELRLTCERETLYSRIDKRLDSYIERGLVEEVAKLHEMGYPFDLPAMSGIGYRQMGEYLLGRATLPEAVQRIKWDTHAFTRHQTNWFKRKSDAHALDVTHNAPLPYAAEILEAFLLQTGVSTTGDSGFSSQ